MLRDAVKLGLVTALGLGVVATVGVGVGVVTLVAGAIFAGVSSSELPKDDTGILNGGSKPKAEEKKQPKQSRQTSPHVSPQEKRPSETTKKQTSQPTSDIESKFGRLPLSKGSVSNLKAERTAPTPTPTNIQSKSDRAPDSKSIASNAGDFERKAPTPTPNRQRSSSVVVNKPGDATTSSKEDAPRVGSSNGTTSPDKPKSLSRELEAQIAPEVKHWRNERPSSQETKKPGTATGRGISEKPSSRALTAKVEKAPVPESSASLNTPRPLPLPLLPPSPIPNPKSTPHLSEAILVTQSKPEMTATVPSKEENTPSQNGTSQDEPLLSTPGDLLPAPLTNSTLDISPPLQAVPAQETRPEVPVSLQASEEQRHPDILPPTTVPVASAPIEESTDLAADAMLASTLLSMKLEADSLDTSSTPKTTATNTIASNGSSILLQESASASRDSLASVHRGNSKLSSAAKKVTRSVKKVFKGPNDKIIHSDLQRLTSSSSDSVDSQLFAATAVDPEQRALSKLASSSRESLASTKSRRSIMDGTKKGLKRMFKGSSDKIDIPPVPPLPSLVSSTTNPEATTVSSSSEKPAVVSSAYKKPAKGFSPKSGASQQQQHPQPQQAYTSVSNPLQSTRNAPGTPEAGNNASPLLKGMFKGRVRR